MITVTRLSTQRGIEEALQAAAVESRADLWGLCCTATFLWRLGSDGDPEDWFQLPEKKHGDFCTQGATYLARCHQLDDAVKEARRVLQWTTPAMKPPRLAFLLYRLDEEMLSSVDRLWFEEPTAEWKQLVSESRSHSGSRASAIRLRFKAFIYGPKATGVCRWSGEHGVPKTDWSSPVALRDDAGDAVMQLAVISTEFGQRVAKKLVHVFIDPTD